MDVNDLRQRLIAKAHLHADPDAYRAGVDDAIATLTLIQRWEDALAARDDVLAAPAASVRGAGAVEQAAQPERARGVS